MSKLHLWSILFLIVAVIAFVPLTVEIFGDMNPNVITISAIIMWLGLMGCCICSLIRVVFESKKKK